MNNNATIAVAPGYSDLLGVLVEALNRASVGKGQERHANGLPFREQDIVAEGEFLGTTGNIFQIRKKAKESLKLEAQDAQENEFLDAIVYSAAAVLILRQYGIVKIVREEE